METKSTHTHGPWTYLPDFGEIWTEGATGDGARCIVRVPPPCNDGEGPEDWRWIEDETDANARLICATPALRDALQDVLSRIERSEHWWIDCPDRGGFDVAAIRAALAQATGEG